eukprot:m.302137 g.302137  ORF g.302137 m.302137 type:complete len:491 (+) comp15034_c0_seq1:186-1658(+)
MAKQEDKTDKNCEVGRAHIQVVALEPVQKVAAGLEEVSTVVAQHILDAVSSLDWRGLVKVLDRARGPASVVTKARLGDDALDLRRKRIGRQGVLVHNNTCVEMHNARGVVKLVGKAGHGNHRHAMVHGLLKTVHAAMREKCNRLGLAKEVVLGDPVADDNILGNHAGQVRRLPDDDRLELAERTTKLVGHVGVDVADGAETGNNDAVLAGGLGSVDLRQVVRKRLGLLREQRADETNVRGKITGVVRGPVGGPEEHVDGAIRLNRAGCEAVLGTRSVVLGNKHDVFDDRVDEPDGTVLQSLDKVHAGAKVRAEYGRVDRVHRHTMPVHEKGVVKRDGSHIDTVRNLELVADREAAEVGRVHEKKIGITDLLKVLRGHEIVARLDSKVDEFRGASHRIHLANVLDELQELGAGAAHAVLVDGNASGVEVREVLDTCRKVDDLMAALCKLARDGEQHKLVAGGAWVRNHRNLRRCSHCHKQRKHCNTQHCSF